MEDSSSDRSPLGVLAEEFVERYRKGQRPSLTEYAERAPELADEIRSLFPTLVEMEQLKPVTGDHTGPYQSPMPDLERLGEFRILRRVGVGGMGVVYEAVQESLGRHVALKVLPSDALADPKRLERFRREAKAAAKLHHTNIVPVFGTGDADGRHYYAMQFITGHPLDAVIDEVQRLKGQGSARGDVSQVAQGLVSGTFPAENPETTPPPDAPGGSPSSLTSGNLSGGRSYWATVARIGEQVASALAYAHGQGVLHRDIKPANLLLDLHGTVWVADFGLAKAHDSDGLTHAGDIVGTLRYMAPERFDGGGDHRADVYALGLTLYELLSLKPAFNADNRAKLVEQVVAAAPPNPRSVNPAVPRDLETIVLKAIARDPAMRYQSPTELADDLRRYQEDRPIAARRASRFEQARRWCRRNPAVAGLLAGLFLVFAAGAGVSALFAVRAERNELAARRHAAEAQENLERAERNSEQAAVNAAQSQENAKSATENARQAAAREKEAIERGEQLRREQEHSRRLLYASQIQQAGTALNDERIPRLRQLLTETKPKPGEPDLRGWEWHFLERECGTTLPTKELQLKRDPQDAGYIDRTRVKLSSDGRLAVHVQSLSEGAWFEIWNLDTSERVGRVPATGLIKRSISTARGGFNTVPQNDKTVPYIDPVLGPDGKHLAALCPSETDEANARLRIWDIATGKELEFPAISVPRTSELARIGPDAATASWFENAPASLPRFGAVVRNFNAASPFDVVFWTRETGKKDRKRFTPTRYIAHVTVTADGRRAIVLPFTSFGRTPTTPGEVWDLTADPPKRLGQPPEVTGDKCHSIVSNTLSFLAVASRDLGVYRVEDMEPLWHMPLIGMESKTLFGVSDDGRRVAFADGHRLHVYDKTGDDAKGPVRQWSMTLNTPLMKTSHRLAPDGRRLITVIDPTSAKDDSIIRVTDISRGPHEYVPAPIAKKEEAANALESLPSGGIVVRDAEGREIGRVPDPAMDAKQFAQSIANGRRLLVIGSTEPAGKSTRDPAKSSWKLYALNGPGDMPLLVEGAGRATAFKNQTAMMVLEVDPSPNNAGLRTAGRLLTLIDMDTGKKLNPQPIPLSNADSQSFSFTVIRATNRVLLEVSRPAPQPRQTGRGRNDIGGFGGQSFNAPRSLPDQQFVMLFDLATGKELGKARITANFSRGQIQVGPDGQRIVYLAPSGANGSEVTVVRTADGSVERRFSTRDNGRSQELAGLAPDGRAILIRGGDIQLWDIDTGTLSQSFEGNTVPAGWRIEEALFSKDGRRLFVLGNKLHVWDLTTGRELLVINYEGGPQTVRSGMVRFEGDKLIVKNGNGSLVYDGTPEKP